VTIRNDPERTLIPSPARPPKESRRKLPPMSGNPRQAMAKRRARAETSLIPDQLESHRNRPGANAAGFFASRTYRGVAMFDNISSRVHPAGGRRKLPPEPGKPRKINERNALLSQAIPAYPRPTRRHQDRPVTPEVAGSSPVAPVSPFALQIGVFCCLSKHACRNLGQQTGSTLILRDEQSPCKKDSCVLGSDAVNAHGGSNRRGSHRRQWHRARPPPRPERCAA
jgi:hypothetical protein